ncbi:MAG: hypothetical protein HN926_04240 [Chloroflexi bacterium]|jgi:hypothetical protein|nr:hypothetical protein [Chloroflexota bacterium]MBT3862729.1 hypothetical protein [Chloroflexota bacterium]MBT4143070.1 hypothetical protein [Chloroflexota bacterium]MBT4943023.1 hypothetical protein [Chloroflexota bacterium]MBT5252654.1 hypothetical protein [Chloroflexota bacterium]
MTATSSTKLITVLAVILAASVLVETLLFRIFARGGVYFISDATPAVIKNGYTSLVFSGNTLFNFAAPVALLVLGFIAVMAWTKRPDPIYTALSGIIGVVAGVGLLMMIGLSGPALSTAYYAASSLALFTFFLLAVRRRAGLPITAFILLTGLSYLAIYSFKGFGSAELAESGIRSINVLSLGEWMSVIAFIALLPLLIGRKAQLDRRSVVIASVISILVYGLGFSRADSVPLIANWAFGLILILPYIAYIVSLWVTVAFVVSRIRRGEVILAAGVLLVMLGHRSIPLTYFNDIVLIGLLLAAMYSKPVTVIEPQVDEVPANLIIADPRDA